MFPVSKWMRLNLHAPRKHSLRFANKSPLTLTADSDNVAKRIYRPLRELRREVYVMGGACESGRLAAKRTPAPGIIRWAAAMLVLVGLTLASTAQGSDWPQWRGPNRDGRAVGAALPAELPAALHQLWKVPVGGGQSSPIVVGDRVFIHARQGEEEVVLALSALTGEELWRHSYAVSYTPRNAAIQYGPGPKSTMLAEGDSVYSFGIRERLLALDAASGKVRWEKTFEDLYEEPYPVWGTASSPLIEGNLLIVPIGTTGNEEQGDEGALVAYDKTTGDEVWRVDGPPAYASPVAFDHGGVRQIVTMDDVSFFGVGATDGDPLWSVDFTTAFQQNTPTTIRYDGNFILSGYQWGTAAIKVEPPAKANGTWSVSEVWKTTDAELYMDSPVLVGDHLYFRSNKRAGTFVCLDPATGEVVWQGPGRWASYASVIAVDDRLLVLTDEAELKVIAADPSSGYQELASWDVADSTTWAHVALSGSRVYVKDEEHLAAFDLASTRVTEAGDQPTGTTPASADIAAGSKEDTEAVKVAVRAMLKAMAAGDMDLMWTYLGEDFRSYSGADKDVFRDYLGSTAGSETKSGEMVVEWEDGTAKVTGTRWITTTGLDFGLEMLVNKRGGKWLVTWMDFDSRRIHGQE